MSSWPGLPLGYRSRLARGGAARRETEPPADIRGADKFAVIELVVLPQFQGKGLASRLMQALLAKRPEPYAMLLAEQVGRARAMYDRWGWRAAQTIQIAPDVFALDVVVRELGIH